MPRRAERLSRYHGDPGVLEQDLGAWTLRNFHGVELEG